MPLNFEIDDTAIEVLESLKETYGANNVIDVIKKALALAIVAKDFVDDENKILILSGDSKLMLTSGKIGTFRLDEN